MTPTFVFNPPTASAMPESDAHVTERLPYELRRQMAGAPNMRLIGRIPRPGDEDTRPILYYVPCKRYNARIPCIEYITVHKVITGTRQRENHGHVTEIEDCVYYWPDTAIVIETGTDYSRRVSQAAFCSMKCLSLWSAKIARDTER